MTQPITIPNPLAHEAPTTEQQIADEIKAELRATLEDQLSEARALLAKHEGKGKGVTVETSSGTRKTIGQLDQEARLLTEELHLGRLEISHAREALAALNPIPFLRSDGERGWQAREAESERPILTPEQAEKMFGLKDWAELSPEHRAQARSIRDSDLNKYELTDYFGAGSNGRRANDLARQNPAAYKLLRRRAVDEGLLGV